MASDSTRITASDPFARNQRSGLPNEDGLSVAGVSGGSFDIGDRLDPVFDRGQTNPGAQRATEQPSAPGSERTPANPAANPQGKNLQHTLNHMPNDAVPLT